jgi:hypothetical protein
MRSMGEKIPALNSRKKRLADLDQKKTEMLALEAAKTAAASAPSPGGGGNSTSNKKKGKKGKK